MYHVPYGNKKIKNSQRSTLTNTYLKFTEAFNIIWYAYNEEFLPKSKDPG